MIENTFGMNIVPDNDSERLEALKRYRIMDTPSENSFDNIARLATKIFKVPISLVSLVDADRVFFKANVGMGNAKEANRGKSLCALAVLDPEVTIFEDAIKEPCLMANPNVAGNFGLRFYAGAPLITFDGFLIGTLCIIDKQPRVFTVAETEILKGLATAIMDQIELRLSALDEITKQQQANEEIIAQREELHAINEEMAATNEELLASQEELSLSNQYLVQSENQFRKLIKMAPVGIAIYGPEKIIEQANPAMLKLWARTDAVIGKPVMEARPEIKGHAFASFLDEIFETGIEKTGHGIKVPVDYGDRIEEKYFDASYKPIFDDHQKIIGIMAIAVDATDKIISQLQDQESKEELVSINEELLSTNEELLLSRRQLTQASENLNDALAAGGLGFTELEFSTGVMHSSAQFKNNYGFAADENFNYADLFNTMLPQYHDQVKKKVETAVETGGVYHAEYEVKWPDGSLHWISAHGRPNYAENGKVKGMIGMNKDITENKIFEQRKDDFLSIASHELKTPVTSLRASLQLLNRMKDKPMSPIHIKLIEQSNKSLDKMSTLIDDLLNVNRLAEGQLQLEKSTFTVIEMLEDCCSHVRLDGKYKITIKGDADLQIFADEHRINQVVTNFVNNAVKYAPESKEVILGVEKIGNNVKISVKDNGPGIPIEKQAYIFDRYYRAENETKSYNGLGLGLYICSEIVRRHDGQIGVESEPGHGSNFWFILPA